MASPLISLKFVWRDMKDNFQLNGFTLVRKVLAPSECENLNLQAKAIVGASSVCTRLLLEIEWCQALAKLLRERLKLFIPSSFVAVQCTYFEKSKDYNWLVPVHQDLCIPVLEEIYAEGFGPWSRKEGELFVQAPEVVLNELVAVRVHLEPCLEIDGPLQVVSGSHLMGVLTSEDATEIKNKRGITTCVASIGDAIVMRPLLLHSSSKATGTSLRRVLHFLFGPAKLPNGLQWRHAV